MKLNECFPSSLPLSILQESKSFFVNEGLKSVERSMSHGPGAGRKHSAQAGPFYDVINEGKKKNRDRSISEEAKIRIQKQWRIFKPLICGQKINKLSKSNLSALLHHSFAATGQNEKMTRLWSNVIWLVSEPLQCFSITLQWLRFTGVYFWLLQLDRKCSLRQWLFDCRW